jgi:hypothetical protein
MRRAVMACVIASLLVLKGAFPAFSANSAGNASLDQGFGLTLSAATGELCATPGDHEAPGGRHEQRSQCCIFCTTRDASLAIIFRYFETIAYLVPIIAAPIVYPVSGEPRSRLFIWTNAQSPRAPPELS